MAEEEQERESNNNSSSTKKDSSVPGKLVLSLILLLFLPAFVLGLLMYAILLRKLRQRISVSFVVSSIIGSLSLIVWYLSDAGIKFLGVIENWRYINVYWVDLVPAFVSVNILLGSLFGFILILWEVRQIKSNPHRVQLEGSWMYKFKFRRTPWEYYKRKKKIKGLMEGKYHSEEKIAIGIDEEDNIVYRYNTEMHQSTLISGTTGSGKTITMLNSMLSDIINGISIIVIDFKRSQEFSTKLAQWANEQGRDFYHFDNGAPEEYKVEGSPGHAFYDPLKNSGSAKADMILGMREYDTAAAVYKQNMRELLQTLFFIMKYADKKKTKNIKWDQGEIYKINSIVNGLNGSAEGNLMELIDATSGTEAESVARDFELKVKKKTSGLNQAFIALQGQMSTLVNSEYGRWLKYEKNDRNIDLYKLLKEPGNVILFSMDGLSEKDFARYMGSLILSDLSAVSAMRLRNGIDDHVNVYIDEFQAVSPTSLAPLLEKSRASGFGTTMASQSYEQIISAAESNGEAQLNSILDTCANFIVHAGATEKSAQRLSNIAGQETKTIYRQANQNQSFIFSLNWKNRRNQMVHTSTEKDWIAPPSKFMNLSMPKSSNNYKTEAIIVKKSSDEPNNRGKEGVVIKKVWMIPTNRVLEKHSSIEEEEAKVVYDEEISPEVIEDDENIDNFLQEKEFNIPEPPVDYMHHASYEEEPFEDRQDELDEFSQENIDNEEVTDGDFEFSVIDEEDDDLSNNINIDFPEDDVIERKENKTLDNFEKRENFNKSKTPQLSKSTKLPVRPPKSSNVSSMNNSAGDSFSSIVGSDSFKPAKRRKERPPIVDDDDDLDDALPDFNF